MQTAIKIEFQIRRRIASRRDAGSIFFLLPARTEMRISRSQRAGGEDEIDNIPPTEENVEQVLVAGQFFKN